MYNWFVSNRNRTIFIVMLFLPVILFLGGIMLVSLNMFNGWAYWNLFQKGFFMSFYLFPAYVVLSAVFLIAALVRKSQKKSGKYYWWLAVVIMGVPLIVVIGLGMLNR